MATENKTPETDNPTPEEAPAAAETPEVEAAAPGGSNGAPDPADELLLGELTPQEMLGIQQVRGKINQHLMEIGHLEVQKAMKLASLDQLEQQGQQVIKDARARLGLDEAITLQVTPDGKIRRLPPVQDNVVPMHPGQPPAAG